MNISVLTCLWIISSVYFPFSILNGFISSQTYFLLISPASLRRWDSRPKLCRYDKWIVFPCRYSQVAQRWEHLQQTPCSGWSEMLSVPLDGWYRPEGQQQSIWSHRVSVLIKKKRDRAAEHVIKPRSCFLCIQALRADRWRESLQMEAPTTEGRL